MQREQIGTALFAGTFAVLVWLWAEGENRAIEPHNATIRFAAAPGGAEYLVRIVDKATGQLIPSLPVEMELEGPNASLQRALLRNLVDEVRIENPSDDTERDVDLRELLRDQPQMADAGITVVSVSPAQVTIHVDELEQRSVPVSAALPNLDVEQMTIEPRHVPLKMPKSQWAWATEEFGEDMITLNLNESVLRNLRPGEQHREDDVPLRLPRGLDSNPAVTFDPPPVSVTLALARELGDQIEWTVPVRINVPPRDANRFDVVIDLQEYELIPGVIISADRNAIEQLRERKLRVFAVVNLSSDDLEQGITSKQIEWMLPPGMKAQMPAGEPLPVIPLTIVQRPEESE